MAKYCKITIPPREPQHNKNSHRQEGHALENRINIAMKNAHSLYKLRRRNVVGMLTMSIQNT
jgi:hypothetical protein